jgi:tetratricopeptide (TPR) repeat protein
LLFADGVGPQGKLADIVTLLSEGHDSVSAVSNVLGDLKEVQKQLNRHIMRGSFSAIVVPSPPDIPLDSLPVRTLSPAESALLLGRYFLDPGEMELCRHWLEIALRESASNLLAHTLLGRLEYWQGNYDKALAHFDAALRCGSEPHLVYFYRGKLFADEKSSHYSMAKATEDFQRAVQINAGFAPARAALAETYQRQGQNLHEAELLVTRAIEADPANFDYRIILAAIESKLGRWDLAQRVVRVAFALAQTPQEKEKARSLREELAQRRPVSSGMANANHFAQAEEVGSLPTLRRRPAPPRESLQTADGIAANVRCRGFQLEFELLREGETLHFLSENILELTYFRSDRSAPIYFDPCRELRGKTVKVRFKWRSESGISGTVSSIELLN